MTMVTITSAPMWILDIRDWMLEVGSPIPNIQYPIPSFKGSQEETNL
jgi:hypothetical protein